MEVNPVSVILVKADSKGDRLLFRYPYEVQKNDISSKTNEIKKNPYAVSITDDVLQNTPPPASNIINGELRGFTDEVLSTLFAVKPELTNQKFELKVNDVRFVSHPTQMQPKDDSNGSILINVVFALHAQASYSIVKCYYELSKKLGYALKMEEERVAYLTEEMGIMVKTHDEVANVIEQKKSLINVCEFDLILERSSLAQSLKSIYHDLCTTGLSTFP
uniref:Uncharacterized protein n=1 Tax=Megaselia scalaris TaxID=36166 RepID=T1GNF3_MEGSC